MNSNNDKQKGWYKVNEISENLLWPYPVPFHHLGGLMGHILISNAEGMWLDLQYLVMLNLELVVTAL